MFAVRFRIGVHKLLQHKVDSGLATAFCSNWQFSSMICLFFDWFIFDWDILDESLLAAGMWCWCLGNCTTTWILVVSDGLMYCGL